MTNDDDQPQDEDGTNMLNGHEQPPDEDKDTTSSSDDKGSSGGSGHGYAADIEGDSSDTSSDKGNDANDKEPASGSLDKKDDNDDEEEDDRKPPAQESLLQQRDDEASETTESSKYHPSNHQAPQAGDSPQSVQLNGVRIQHHMDPRIDLSSVGFLHSNYASSPAATSQMMLKFPPNAFPPLAPNHQTTNHATSARMNENGEPPPMFPSFEQYMKLMECVRPFFNAHGISSAADIHKAMGSDEPNSSERTSSELPTGSSDSDQRPSIVDLLDTTRNMAQNWSLHHHDLAVNATNAAVAARNDASRSDRDSPAGNEAEGETDSSSMVVLARPKRKHSRTSFPESSLSNTNSGGSNDSNSGSAASSNKRVRIQHPEQRAAQPQALGADEAVNQEEDGSNDQDDAQLMDEGNGSDQAGVNAEANQMDRREGISSGSSSEDRNDALMAEGANGFGVPAVVSEYASSNRNSSGASNGNGSGGNTGSGSGGNTASGSGSGSGDQGEGISSNNTGSSGSGNDAKGSSEEAMDNSGENNSAANSAENSDSSKKTEGNDAVPRAASPGKATGPLHHHQHHHNHYSNIKMAPNESYDQDVEDAAREKKIIEKKRKRMNMRREYEQELESSEASRDGEIIIRPGKPVTLDKVLSFTKTPRLVVKNQPPFLLVYSNAAYSRLSGIDSHNAVGKPINSLLSLPNEDQLSQLDFDKMENVTSNSTAAISREENNSDSKKGMGSQNHVAAEAAGRARAAAACWENSKDIGLEALIGASGFGRLHMINLRALKSQCLVGRNVKVVKASMSVKRNQDEGSNAGSSITSSSDSYQNFMPCTMSISPVVSSPEAFSSAVVTDREKAEEPHHHKSKRIEKDQPDCHHHKAKRRKHHHQQHSEVVLHQNPFRENHPMKEIAKRHLITHYVIQLEAFDGDFKKFGTMESQSSASTTFEAQMHGMTKAEVRRQRTKAAARQKASSDPGQANQDHNDDGDHNEEMESDDISEARPHVSAIG